MRFPSVFYKYFFNIYIFDGKNTRFFFLETESREYIKRILVLLVQDKTVL